MEQGVDSGTYEQPNHIRRDCQLRAAGPLRGFGRLGLPGHKKEGQTVIRIYSLGPFYGHDVSPGHCDIRLFSP